MRFVNCCVPCVLVLAVMGFSLTSCVSRTDNTSIVQQSQMAARPATTAPATTAPPNGPRISNKVVPSGKTTTVEGLISLSVDCSPVEMTVRIAQQPVHGTAVVAEREDYPNFPPKNPRSACNPTKALWQYVDYTPVAGFTGTDVVTLNLFSDKGQAVEEKILITVK